MKKEDINPVMDKEYYDNVVNCGITLTIKDEMYLIKDGNKMRLNAFIIKERKGN